ncbi:kinase-like protein [Venturia nashicola]|uniref:non-specific serine/threonine protein kinase n=1 Tax=Venturia nashicola TaxID=86259 RepID=A0A4Z1PAX4_9PEZI|nr:kinase-like protein [Venturia nashicola]
MEAGSEVVVWRQALAKTIPVVPSADSPLCTLTPLHTHPSAHSPLCTLTLCTLTPLHAHPSARSPLCEHVVVYCISIANPGGNGSHVCLVFDLMAETIQTFAGKYGGSIPPWLMKRFAKQMLHALDYAHKAGVIHTDIKADNIMIQLPNESVVDERYMDNDAPAVEPSPMKTSELNFLT